MICSYFVFFYYENYKAYTGINTEHIISINQPNFAASNQKDSVYGFGYIVNNSKFQK